MFDFFKFRNNKNKNNEEDDDKKLNSIAHNSNIYIQSNDVSTNTIADIEASDKFNIQSDKPRKDYVDGNALKQTKIDAFKANKSIHDPYDNQELTLTTKEAKAKYGKNYKKHLAEVDHRVSVNEIFKEHENDSWITKKQLKSCTNDKINLRLTSKSNNASKRDLSEEKFTQKKYEKGEMSKASRDRLIKEDKTVRNQIENKIFWHKVGNIADTFNDAGLNGAKASVVSSATLSVLTNMIDVVQRKKDPKEACMEVAKTASISGIKGYVQTGALTVINRTLSKSSSQILQCLGQNNYVGKAIMLCQVAGDSLIKLLNHEIDACEATERITKSAAQAIIIGEASAIGASIIGEGAVVAVVGGAVGALVGMLVCKEMMGFFETLKKRREHIKELQEMQRQYDQVTQFFHKYRLEYQNFAQKFNLEKKEFFTEQLLNIDDGLLYENYEQVTKATNNITTALGGEVLYDNLDDFCDFLDS